MIKRFWLRVCLWIGLACFTIGARAQDPIASANFEMANLRGGLSLWDRFESDTNGFSVLKGVVTYVDGSRNLVVLQQEEKVYSLRLAQTNNVFKVGEFVEMECEIGLYSPVLPSFPDQPAAQEIRQLFEAPSDWHDYFLARMRGFLRPAVSGDYTFWIASDDSSELWLSDGDDPKRAQRIAYVPEGRFTLPREWTRTGTQQSKRVRLEAEQCYYVEALHQDTRSRDCLAVAWQGPGFERAVIDEKFLRPWPTFRNTNSWQASGILWEAWTNFYTTDLSAISEYQKDALKCTVIRVLKRSQGKLPSPILVQADKPLESQASFRCVDLEGELQFVSRVGEWLELELRHGNSRVKARVKIEGDWTSSIPLNTTVRVKGFFEPERSFLNGVVEGTVWVDQTEDIHWDDREENWSRVPMMAQHLVKADNRGLGAGKFLRLMGEVEEEESPGLWRMRGKDTIQAYVSPDGTNWSALGVPIELQLKNTLLAGFAVASSVTGAVAEVQYDHVAGLGDMLNGANIGKPPIDGRHTIQQGGYTVAGNGADIWRQADQGYFAYEPKFGDFQIIAHLEKMQSIDSKAKSVVILRESLEPESAWVGMTLAPNNRVGLQWRSQSGNNAVGMLETRPEKWIKLIRQRNQFLVKAKSQTLRPGQQLEIAGRLGWFGQTPLLDDVRVRPAPALSPVAPQFAPIVSPPAGGRVSLIKNISTEAVAVLSAGSRFSLRARIGGVVTFAGQVGDEWLGFVQDQSAGSRVIVPPIAGILKNLFKVGSEVEMVGTPMISGKSPEFIADGLVQIGRAIMPEPIQLPSQWPEDASLDAQWTEVQGVVRSVTTAGRLQIMTRAGIVEAVLNSNFTNHYIDSLVRVRGVFWRLPEPVLLLPSEGCVAVVEAASEDIFNVPLFPVAAILTNRVVPATDRRLKICGVVTGWRDDFLVVQDETGGIRLDVRGQTNLFVGDKIEAVGFLRASPNGQELSEVVFRRLGVGKVSELKLFATEDIFQPKNRGRLVSLEAMLVALHPGHTLQTLDLQSGQRVFRALLPISQGKLDQIAAGSQLRLTGVMMTDGGEVALDSASGMGVGMVGSVEILLRSPQDVSVIQSPPWWNWKYTVATVGLLFLILVGSTVWIRTLRRQVEQRATELRQTMGKLQKETQTSATLAERNRIAGEIHDGLEQGLTAIMMQLDALESKLGVVSTGVARHLEFARSMVRFSRTEVRHSLWDWKSPALANKDLGSALTEIARQMSAENETQVAVHISGNVLPLPTAMEHDLLRVAQEALNNALKYSGAGTISIHLDYGEDNLRLSVRDNGRGFDADKVLSGEAGHFGLQNLRSRARRMGGSLKIKSDTASGTVIEATVPLPKTNLGGEDPLTNAH